MRLVVDTSVIVAAFRSHNGASRALIAALDEGWYELVLSTALFLEYEAVLLRPDQLDAHAFDKAEVTQVLDTLAARSVHVVSYYDWRPQLRDAADEMVLATAINGFAQAIITHNLRDFSPATQRFGINVLTPAGIMSKRRKP